MKLDSVKAKAKSIRNRFMCAAGGAMCAIVSCPAFAMAAGGADGLAQLKGTLSNIASAGGFLCIFAALVLFAMGKLGDGNGARGEGMMVGLALAAVAFFAAALFIGNVDFKIATS